jgi:tRNA modification GTPase
VPSFPSHDTICAIATPIGEGGIGIVKISGDNASAILAQLFHPHPPGKPLRSHRLLHGWVKDPGTHESVDEVLVCYMAGPNTYTREDVAEINCHSGFAILQRILRLVVAAGARLAEPGEFTRRAFMHGRIDLTQAEAVIEVIRSRSERSLTLANQHLRGAFRHQIQRWLDEVIALQAQLEAGIDFAEDLADEAAPETSSMAAALAEKLLLPMAGMIAQYDRGRILRDGLKLVLVGKPNVGKSSLLNALLGRDRAIVTAFPGTTRDVIEDSFVLAGVEVRVLDTAGIRHQPDEIEVLGIARTHQSLETADVVLWLLDQSGPLTAEDDSVFEAVVAKRQVILLNKADLPRVTELAAVRSRFATRAPVLNLSVFCGDDIERLKLLLIEEFLRQPLETVHGTLVPNLRQHQCLEQAHEALARASLLLNEGDFPELVSVELQAAGRQLALILGRETDDGLLEQIFSRFCVGK